MEEEQMKIEQSQTEGLRISLNDTSGPEGRQNAKVF